MKIVSSGKRFLLVLIHVFLLGFFLSPTLSGASPRGLADADAPHILADSPLQVRSWEDDGLLVAEIHGRIDYPFDRIGSALTRPAAWCEFIPLVFNIKSCTYAESRDRTLLTLYVGRKFYDTPNESLRLEYRFRVREQTKDRLQVNLFEPQGPHGTRDYRIELEARATADGRTAIRLLSSYRPSLRSKMATNAYLATAGQDKVGFSIVGTDEEGDPVYVGGMKGIIERNAMRYYLALKAFLDTMHLPEERRFEARLQAWFGMTEKYPRQLHEMGRQEYLDAKREERNNQLKLQRRVAGSNARA